MRRIAKRKPAKHQRRHRGAENLRGNECRRIDRSDARKGIRVRPCQGNGGIRERGRRSKPVSRGDVGPDGECHRRLAMVAAAQDDRHQPEGGDEFTPPLSATAAHNVQQLRNRNQFVTISWYQVRAN